MAITASISLSSASITVGQVLNAVLTVSNSAAVPVTVIQILPRINFTGNPVPMDGSSVAYGDVPLGQGFNNIIPASGSANFLLSYSIYQPSTGLNSNDYGALAGTYDVGALVISNDRSQVSPTVQTVTVNPVLPLF